MCTSPCVLLEAIPSHESSQCTSVTATDRWCFPEGCARSAPSRFLEHNRRGISFSNWSTPVEVEVPTDEVVNFMTRVALENLLGTVSNC